jgi:putative oxidoreductase
LPKNSFTIKEVFMRKLIFKTDTENWSAFILRAVLGIVLFAHGAQKLFGWFGGYGFEGTMQFFTSQKQPPWLVGL